MTLSTRIAVAAATAAVAVGGATPAVASSMTHWSKTQCKTYYTKWEHATGSKRTKYNKELKDHGCSQKIK